MIEITTIEQFNNLLEKHYGVVLDVYGDWCMPCKTLAPKLEMLSKRYSGNDIVFCKCDIETKLFEASGLPTIHFFVNGEKIDTVLGADITKITNIVQSMTTVGTVSEPNDDSGWTTVAPKSKKKGSSEYKSYKDYNH